MRSLYMLFVILVVISISPVFSQTLNDYILSTRGDTLVIKDFNDAGGKSNTLYNALLLDTSKVPAGRVYMLSKNGYYPNANNITTTTKMPTTIVGEDSRILVTNKDALSAPPVICGATIEGGGANTGNIAPSNNFLIKNVNIIPAASDGTLGFAAFTSNAANISMTFDNCLMERTRWIFVFGLQANLKMYLRNCYIVNMNGEPNKRNGGVYDGFTNQDTMLVENCTNVMAQGSMYKFRNYPFNRVIFNHNTFVNCAGYMFMSLGYQSNMSLTNNIFVNCNVQAYPSMQGIDPGEQDPDWIPMGLVNVYPDSADVANHVARKFLVEGNVIYWDPSLSNCDSILDNSIGIGVTNKGINGVTNWQSQMITMNSRTQSMFNNNATYPYLTEGVWYKQMPHFTDPKDLFTTQLANIKTWAIACVDTASKAVLPDWRLVNIGPDFYVYSDWPIPVDLSYNDAKLLTGATNGFPVGDLNWFPNQKATWLTQRTAEYTAIQHALDNGSTTIPTAVKDVASIPNQFQLDQNYPNPFNPNTKIAFTLEHSANTSLVVIDMLGREVATLVNGFTTAGSHEVIFNATNFASGVYFYKLTSGSLTQIKKMTLVK